MSSAGRAGARNRTDEYFLGRRSYGVSVLARLSGMAIRRKWHFGSAIVVTLLGASFFLWIPLLLGQGVDQAFTLIRTGGFDEGAIQSLLLKTALLIILVSALRGAFGFLQMFLGETLSQRVAAELRMRYFDKLQELSFSFHDNVHTGNLMSRGISDIEGVRMFIQTGLVRTFYVVILVTAGAFFMIAIDWKLALISLGFIPFVVFRSAQLRLHLRQYWRWIQEKLGELSTTVQENLAGTRVVRAFSAQDFERRQFIRQARDVQRLMVQALTIHARGGSVISFSFLVAWALILWFGGREVIHGAITVGELTQFLAFMALLQFPVRMIPFIVNSVARAHSAGTRVMEVLDEETDVAERPGAAPLQVSEGVARFDNVCFSFGDVEAIRDVSFEASPTHSIGIVGPPGSGKSTIANLLPRFYDADAGHVTVDGVDVQTCALQSLRRAVGIVQQDPFLFDGTIRDNIRYGRPDASDEEVEEAARIAQLHEFILSLPDGYDTTIGERGITVSGGQRQRMAIARTVLLDPPIIIFDDATSSVDAGTDRRIRAELRMHSREKTTITIAHRLSSLQFTDEILVMDAGRITERGSHQELLRLRGRYWELHELQALPDREGGSANGTSATGPAYALSVARARQLPSTGPESVTDPTDSAEDDPDATDRELRPRARLKESDSEMFARLDSTVFRRFVGYLGPYRRGVVLATVAVIVFTLANLAIPLLVKVAIDSAIEPGNAFLLAAISIGMGAVAVIHWGAMYLQRVLIQHVGQDILFDIRRDLFEQLQRLSMSFSDRTPVGGLMSRIFGDVGALQEMLDTTVEAIGDMLLLVGIVVVLLVLDWRLALLTMSVMPALALIRMVWQPFARRAFLRIRRDAASVGSYLDQNVSGVRVIQAVNRQPVNHEIMDGKVGTLFTSYVRGSRLGGALMPAVDLLTGTAFAIVILVGGNMALSGSLDAGVMVAYLLYVQRFFEPIRSLTMHYTVLQRAVAAGHRIFELLDLPIEIRDTPTAGPLGAIDGSLQFQHVTFGYEPRRPVLKDVSFSVAPGQTMAIVGPTGGGKTSIVSLAHRFYDPQEGRVLIGGVDVRDVTQESIGRQVGMVLQEPFLFSKTVFENVRYNALSATRDDVVEACKIIGAHDFIMRLSDGYETVLEQRGSNLSVGQRQLLSFARALVADPQILILDEATANIDSYTEQVIQKALEELLQDRTALVIAHRLSTIHNADSIIVVMNGEIVERGGHDELVSLDGLYAHLWRMNYASFDDLVAVEGRLGGPAMTST